MIARCCILLLAIFLISCNREKEELIDLSEIMPGAEWENDEKEVQRDDLDSLSGVKERFRTHGISFASLVLDDSGYLPDRFGADQTEKYILITQSDTIKYLKWNYTDSMKVMNSFFNWMDCYGEDCRSIYIGEEAKFQECPMQIYVNDTSLIYIAAKHNVDFDSWIAYHKSLNPSFTSNYLIEQRSQRRAKWFIFVGDKKTEYKNENSQ